MAFNLVVMMDRDGSRKLRVLLFDGECLLSRVRDSRSPDKCSPAGTRALPVETRWSAAPFAEILPCASKTGSPPVRMHETLSRVFDGPKR